MIDRTAIITALRARLTLRALREEGCGMLGMDVSGAEAVLLVVNAASITPIPAERRYRNSWCSHRLMVNGRVWLLAVEYPPLQVVDWAGYSKPQRRAK